MANEGKEKREMKGKEGDRKKKDVWHNIAFSWTGGGGLETLC